MYVNSKPARQRVICFVTELYPPSIGGQEVRFQEFATRFSELGFRVSVLTIDHLGTLPAIDVVNPNLTVYRVIAAPKYRQSRFAGRRIRDIMRFTWAVIRHYRKESAELYYYNQWPLLPLIFARGFAPAEAVHVLDFVEYRESSLWRMIQRSILRAADTVVCISRGVMNKARANTPGRNYLVIPSVVNVAQYPLASGSNFVFLGRLQEHKNPGLAIEAVLAWNQKSENSIPIDVIGDGELLSQLKARYQDNPLVRLHGFVDDATKFSLLEGAYINILPSRREGLPKSVIEAMVCGVPSITTRYVENGTCAFIEETGIGLVANPAVGDLIAAIDVVREGYPVLRATCLALRGEYDLGKAVATISDLNKD